MSGSEHDSEQHSPEEDDFGSAALAYAIAGGVTDVIAAWELVYLAYRRAGLINANPYHIHTAPQMVTPDAAVITGKVRGIPVSTLTSVIDMTATCGSLPLDRVFADELNALRDEGARLLEIGLFADRRKHLARTAESLFELMRYAFFFGMTHEVTDFLIGVHPRHTRFYIRAFGFEPQGDVKTYAAVRDHPVVLMRGEVAKGLSRESLAPAVKYAFENPVPARVYERRFRFDAEEVAHSTIGRFLHYTSSDHPLSQAG